METKAFLKKIRMCQRKLNMAEFVKVLLLSMMVGSGMGILFQSVAFCIPFYYASHYSGLAMLTSVITAIIVAVCRRKSLLQTALYMDSFGFKERIVTACEHLEEEGEMVIRQRKDACEHLEKYGERIKVPLISGWKKPVLAVSFLLIMMVLMMIPSEVKKQAKEMHLLKKEVQEKEEEIKEVLDELEKVEELAEEILTPQQLAALQEMMESLQAAMQEYSQVENEEMLKSANGKMDYKYHNMSNQLSDMASMLQNGANISTQSLQAMQELAAEMQELSNGSMGGNTGLAGNQGLNGEQNNGNNGSNQSGNQQNQGNGANGQGENNQNSGQNGQNSQNGNGQNGQGNNGNGQGQGSGQGQSNGSGQGNGNGGGNGSGRGEGNGAAPHDYVSIPNEIADSGNLSGNATNHEDSDYFLTRDGLSWKGSHVSHEAVMGSYEKNAYEGIAAGKYPSGMEEVIKEYFTSLGE